MDSKTKKKAPAKKSSEGKPADASANSTVKFGLGTKPKKPSSSSSPNKPQALTPKSMKTAKLKDLSLEHKPKRPEKTSLLYDAAMAEYKCRWDEDYVECPDRILASYRVCEGRGLVERCETPVVVPADKASMLPLHTEEYIDKIESTKSMSEEDLNSTEHGYDGTMFHKNSWHSARLALGATFQLIDDVVLDRVANGIAVVRPPGHHAMRDEACGFCYFNNVALAAERCLTAHSLKRILIVDWDVHHGQGTQFMFYDDPRVMYISIHRYEHGWYWPGLREGDLDFVGKGGGQGYNINIPLNKTGMTDSDYLAIFHNLVLPLAAEFDPEAVIVSAGFDCALGCPEGMMCLTPPVFGHLVQALRAVADGRVALVLEGGYCIESLSHSVAYAIHSLLGDACVQLERTQEPRPELVIVLLKLMSKLRPYWKCFDNINQLTLNLADQVVTQDERGPATYLTEETKPAYYETSDATTDLQFHYRRLDTETKAEFARQVLEIVERSKIRQTQHRSCYFYDEGMMKHRSALDPAHPERPERIRRIHETMADYGLLSRCLKLPLRRATMEELRLCHSQKYINEIRAYETTPPQQFADIESRYNSIYLHQQTWSCAIKAAGGLLNVVDSVMKDQSRNGFAIIRPPGHHAEVHTAFGFCFFNSVPIAAKYAQQKHAAKRIVIVDWDVHHGNGTQHMFEDDPSVLYISLHRYENGWFFPSSQDGNYDKVGKGAGEGFNVNIPFNARYVDERRCRMPGDPEYLAAFRQIVIPICYEFAPDLILISAGFDAARGDPLGGYNVTPAGYAHMTHMLCSLAGGRVVIALEGGYNLTSISESYSACVRVLLGAAPQRIPYTPPELGAAESIQNVVRVHRKYWKSLITHEIPPSMADKVKPVSEQIKETEAKAEIKTEITHEETEGKEVGALASALEGAHISAGWTKLGMQSIPEDTVLDDSIDAVAIKRSSKSPKGTQATNGAQAAGEEDPPQLFTVIPLMWCAHLEDNTPLPHELDTKAPCAECGDTKENWVCLTCYKVYCSRYVNEHMLFHALESEHRMVLSYRDLSVWCYSCDSYVHNEDLLPMKNSAHRHKFGVEMPD